MKVLVVGITGRIGKRVAKRLLKQGHSVVGVNRRAERVAAVWGGKPDFQTVAFDAFDGGALAAVVAGVDSVVFASTPTRENPDEFLQQNRNIIAAVSMANPHPRLVALSGTYALNAPDGSPLLQSWPPNPYFLELESVFAKQAQLYRTGAGDLDWLLIAPAAETFPYGEATGKYRVQEDVIVTTDSQSQAYRQTSVVSMEDVAHLIVAELEHPQRHRQLISLGY